MLYLLAKIVALFLIIAGCILILRPETIDKIKAYVKEGNRVYGVGVLRIVIGLILLQVSFQSRVTWIVFVIGLLPLASGVLIFALRKEKIFELVEKFYPKTQKNKNLIGTIPLVLGVLLFCAL